jgi:hypothetical protein
MHMTGLSAGGSIDSGMAHGLAVNPGSGAGQCGTTRTYYLNYICSSYYTAKFWGLDGTSGGGTAAASPDVSAPTTMAS